MTDKLDKELTNAEKRIKNLVTNDEINYCKADVEATERAYKIIREAKKDERGLPEKFLLFVFGLCAFTVILAIILTITFLIMFGLYNLIGLFI